MRQTALAHPPLLRTLDRPISFHRCFVTVGGSITAALLLSQAMYWQQRTKSQDGWFFKTREEWTEETGLSRFEQESARRNLRKRGLLHERLRGVPAQLWYRVDEIRLLELLSAPDPSGPIKPGSVSGKPAVQLAENQPTSWSLSSQQVGYFPADKLVTPPPTTPFYSETTPETTTEITTTTQPSSSQERAAETESGRGGGSEIPLPEDRAKNPEIDPPQSGGPKSEKTASKEEMPGEQGQALAYPGKLTDQEFDDIAAQLGPLPPDTAQQMLDVIEAQRREGRIKTNPASVIRGIVRKYRADPSSFDPSTGYHVAEQRRLRAVADARLRQAAQAPPPAPLAPPPGSAQEPQNKERPAGLRDLLKTTQRITRGLGWVDDGDGPKAPAETPGADGSKIAVEGSRIDQVG